VTTSTARADVVGARVLIGAVLLLGAIVWTTAVRLDDELGGAWWIGHYPKARLGRPATIGFASRFDLPFEVPSATLKLRADRTYEAFFDGIPLGSGAPAGAGERPEIPLEVRELVGPIAAGPHEIVVIVTHPEGVASLRLGLDAVRVGRNCVVTDSGWRVDDDAKKIRERGFDGARYPATRWARPPVSFWGVSSSVRSSRDSIGISRIGVSSWIPSRAATE
jgi:hypothetical protein